VVKLDDQPRRGQMLVGFLAGPDESPRQAGPEFPGSPEAVLDLERFAEVCGTLR
jgi:hypothetical protein